MRPELEELGEALGPHLQAMVERMRDINEATWYGIFGHPTAPKACAVVAATPEEAQALVAWLRDRGAFDLEAPMPTPISPPAPCSTCRGTGSAYLPRMGAEARCPACQGTGRAAPSPMVSSAPPAINPPQRPAPEPTKPTYFGPDVEEKPAVCGPQTCGIAPPTTSRPQGCSCVRNPGIGDGRRSEPAFFVDQTCNIHGKRADRASTAYADAGSTAAMTVRFGDGTPSALPGCVAGCTTATSIDGLVRIESHVTGCRRLNIGPDFY